MQENIFERMRKQAIERANPLTSSSRDYRKWHREMGIEHSKKVIAENEARRIKNVLGRSGISELHQDCTFDNFVVSCDEQGKALSKAKSYAANFGNSFGGFIFSGGVGTGKNHLASAIGNALIAKGKSILVITIPELMMCVRDTYRNDSKLTELGLIERLCNVDLLVLDDVGVQRNNTNEDITIFQIIDKRLSSKKPVGILTNLDMNGLKDMLGDRVVDRLRMGSPTVINFNWGSYRSRVK